MTANLWYLRSRMALVENRIHQVVAHRRGVDPTPDDPFRGLYIGEETVDALLSPSADPVPDDQPRRDEIELEADRLERSGETLRLRRLARTAHLTRLDVELLVIAALPEVDGRWERLYGYLNDDVSKRRATPALAFALAGESTWSASARGRLARGAPLIDLGLITMEDIERPFLTRTVRVPDRVVEHLLGDDTPPRTVAEVSLSATPHHSAAASTIASALTSGCTLVFVREQQDGIGIAEAAAAVGDTGTDVLVVDGRRMENGNAQTILDVVHREAVLTDAVVVLDRFDAIASDVAGHRIFTGPQPVVVVGSGPWQPETSDRLPVLVTADRLTASERIDLWRSHIGGTAVDLTDHDAAALSIAPHLIPLAVRGAVDSAGARACEVGNEHLREGLRMLNSAGLQKLARRVSPAVDWADLVLPGAVVGSLHGLAHRARHRDQVLGEWRMRRGGGRGHGVIGLFAGESGTGKTMAAEVLAADLELEMYTVNLSSVVSKWVGETEKNLDRIFDEAESVNAVLVFDEADALFGKRSEVRDAQDRYANVETAYLLQRMESFEGLAILTTNLRSNLDDAFTRRLDAIIEFPRPDADARKALWQQCLAPPVPCSENVDIALCAESFVLCGGNIRSASVTAAYRAASEGRTIGTADLIGAVEEEYRKLGRLIGAEFTAMSPFADAQST